jgi:hypothetical protein
LISRTVHEAVAGRLKATFDDLGSLSLKNIERPVQAFDVKWDALEWPVEKKIDPTVRGWLSASSDSKQRTDLRGSAYRTVRATTLCDDRAQNCLGCSRQKTDQRLPAIRCPGESTRLVPLAAIAVAAVVSDGDRDAITIERAGGEAEWNEIGVALVVTIEKPVMLDFPSAFKHRTRRRRRMASP